MLSFIFAASFFTSLTAMLYIIKDDMHRFAAKAFGFVIIGNGYRHRHYTLSFKEATAWAACYSDGANVYKRGIWVASKMQS